MNRFRKVKDYPSLIKDSAGVVHVLENKETPEDKINKRLFLLENNLAKIENLLNKLLEKS